MSLGVSLPLKTLHQTFALMPTKCNTLTKKSWFYKNSTNFSLFNNAVQQTCTALLFPVGYALQVRQTRMHFIGSSLARQLKLPKLYSRREI